MDGNLMLSGLYHALCRIMQLKGPSCHLGRWMFRSQEFNVFIRYKSGGKHADVDALSGCALPISGRGTTLSPKDVFALTLFDVFSFAREHLLDFQTAALIQHFDGSVRSPNRRFRRRLKHFGMQDGMLYRKNCSLDGACFPLFVPRQV